MLAWRGLTNRVPIWPLRSVTRVRVAATGSLYGRGRKWALTWTLTWALTWALAAMALSAMALSAMTLARGIASARSLCVPRAQTGTPAGA